MSKEIFTNNVDRLANKINAELKGLELSVKHHTVSSYWRVGKWIVKSY